MTDKVICRFHASTGGCRNGTNCRFSHDLSNVPSQVCLYYMAGHCAFGSRCRYAHVHPDGTALDDEQQHPQNYAMQGQLASAGHQLGDPTTSREDSQAGMNVSHPLAQPGCADAAWEDEEPGSSLAAPASAAAQPAEHRHDALSHSPAARPQPLSGPSSAPGEINSADEQQHSAQDRGLHGTYEGAYDDEWCEGGPSYEDWVAENGFSDDEGWVQHCVEAVLQREQPGYTMYENGYPVDDHEYGNGQHTSFNCNSYPDDGGDSDGGCQELLEEFAKHHGIEAPLRRQQMRCPAFIDPNNSLEQWRRGEGKSQHVQPQTDSRAHAPAWAPAPSSSSLPGSSAAPQYEGGLCAQYCRDGTCSKGASCECLHGIYCKNCQRFALHPSDAQQRSEHAAECLARHRRVSSHVASQLIECCICMELVLSKPEASERKFGLLDCNHAFCLGCIRDWRSRTEDGADIETAVRACPVCRQVTHYVTPSLVWPVDEEEKEAIMGAYRNKLASIDCRNFDFGVGTCPFSTSCMYRHAYRNGQLEERRFRKRVDADGEVGGVRDARLSEFLDASLRSQQAVRRAIRGTVAVL